MQASSLYELNEYIRRVLALNFQQPLWITAEIAQVGRSKGHFYLDLIQKGEGAEILAQAQAVLWATDHRRLCSAHGPEAEAVLQEGLEVKLLIRVDFHERYGLKLQVVDLEPAFTLGVLHAQRRATLEILRKEGLLERNRRVPLPPVLQRIAVVSSEGAAGFQDFASHLDQNPYGYAFYCHLFKAAVQGKNVDQEIRGALDQIEFRSTEFDVVVVIRGGGARMDLAGFDGLELCRRAATMPLPILTGIGHDTDETVLDWVAHTRLKTPTAVADYLLQHNMYFEGALLELGSRIGQAGDSMVKTSAMHLLKIEQELHWGARERLRSVGAVLDRISQNLPLLSDRLIRSHDGLLDQAEAVCRALHPEQVLRRGYSITMIAGKPVTDPAEVAPGTLLETRLKDGTLQSVRV